MTTAISVIPSNLQLPAHLQSPDIIAQIAAANAAAAGGVRAGGFPSISIKSNHFHIKDGDETVTLMVPPTAPGQPALPMMCLEVVVVDANPALSHTFFGEQVNGVWTAKKWEEGMKDEPTCRSANGTVPDADSPTIQNAVCATCPQYQWGSAISKISGKPVRACGDSKQLAVVPAGDLNYKMLGLSIKAGSLKNWGTYIQALSGRGYGVATLVTNITFDQTANGVLQFTFNRFLTEAEYLKVNERKGGDDVKIIVAQSRALAPAVAQLAAPANLGLPPAETPAPVYTAPAAPAEPVAPAAFVGGFGAAPAPVAAPQPAATPAATDPFAGQPPHVKTACDAVGGLETHAGLATYKALTGIDYMALSKTVAAAPAVAPAEPPKRSRKPRAPAEPATVTSPGATMNFDHIPPDIMATIKAVGPDSPAGQALLAAYPAPQATAPAAAAIPAASPAAPLTSIAPPPATPAAAAPTVGFGAAPPAASAAPSPQVVAAGASLADKLRAKLGLAAQPT